MLLEDEKAMVALGQELGRLLSPGDQIALTGSLGAGKTTLARGILQGLGFSAEVPSPTFAIVQQYDPPDVRIPVAHVDFYRVEDPDEIQELGLDDILWDGAIIAEWPDRMPDSFWDNALKIEINIDGEHRRRLTWRADGAWKNKWPN